MANNKIGRVIKINSCNCCGKTLSSEWMFCPFCKNKIETFDCSFCGMEIKSHWRFCPNCKHEVNAEYKNKQMVDRCNDWLRGILKK